jgi:hypothetical protein
MCDNLSRRRNTHQAALVNSIGQCSSACAPFHLDKGDKRALAGNQINFAARSFDPFCEDLPALRGKPHRSLSLALAAALFRQFALVAHAPFISTARA